MLRTSLWAVLSVIVLATTAAHAQDDEVAGNARGDYAWGAEGGAGAPLAEDPMRIMGYLGAGGGFRFVQNLDFNQSFATPPYLDVGAALYFPGGDIRHGPAFFVSANLTGEFNAPGEPGAFQQWVLTPGYQILLTLQRLLDMDHDWLQVQGRLGIPIALSGQDDTVYVSPGVQLAAALQFKFLAGIGVYLEVEAAMFGGSSNTVHPILAADFGFMIDYEVLQ